MTAVPPNDLPPEAGPPDAGPADGGPADAGPPDAGPPDAGPSRVVPANAVADRLIADGRRPLVLGFVSVGSVDDLAGSLFSALAHVAGGADGIDLMLPAALAPAERLSVADQLAEATGTSLYLRTETPMAGGKHALILSAGAGRLRASADVFYDVGIDQPGASADEVIDAWPPLDERSLLLSTVGFRDVSDAALIGLASAASARGVAAISTDRVRIVRRVVDTLAPLIPKVPTAGVTACR